jgi:hypothetical protein
MIIKKQMFDFIKLNREEHGEIPSNAIYVKSPNDNLYVVYKSNIQVGDEKKVGCIVYNYTENRIVHKVIDEAHPRILYTAPIANSFVPIVVARQEKIHIELVNLTEEHVEIVSYNLNDLMNKISSLTKGTMPKSAIRKFNKASIYGLINQDEYPQYVMTKYKGAVPIYKKVTLSIDVADEEELFTILNAVEVTITFENNELIIEIKTGKESHIEMKQSKIGKTKITSGVTLLHKRYKFNSTYNISRSHLYEVNKANKNFILSYRSLYVSKRSNRDDYVVLDYYDGSINLDGMDLILTYNHILLSSPISSLKLFGTNNVYDITNWQDKIKYVRCGANRRDRLTLLDLRKLYNQALRTINIGQENESIILKSNLFITHIDTNKIIKHMICDQYEGNYKKVECIYTYHLDNVKGILYIIMIPLYYEDDTYKPSKYSIAIAEIGFRQSLKNYKVILKTEPYLYETLDEENGINLSIMLKTGNNFSNIWALYEILSSLSRVVVYVDNVYYSNLNKLGHELLIYEQEVLVKVNKKHVVVRDVRHNRIASFRHWIQDESLYFAPIIRRYDNVIMCYWGDTNSSSDEQKLYTLFVISENDMVEQIEM